MEMNIKIWFLLFKVIQNVSCKGFDEIDTWFDKGNMFKHLGAMPTNYWVLSLTFHYRLFSCVIFIFWNP